jgi:hypothetical protein
MRRQANNGRRRATLDDKKERSPPGRGPGPTAHPKAEGIKAGRVWVGQQFAHGVARFELDIQMPVTRAWEIGADCESSLSPELGKRYDQIGKRRRMQLYCL